MQNFESMADAVAVAKQVLAGELNPNFGCGLIASISEKNNHPQALVRFIVLSHEQHEHDSFGITAESCVPDILMACLELLAAQT